MTLTFENMDQYEHAIVRHLEDDFKYVRNDAVVILNNYLPILKLLGGYDGAIEHAQRFHEAYKHGITCDQWLLHILKWRQRFQEHEDRQKNRPKRTLNYA